MTVLITVVLNKRWPWVKLRRSDIAGASNERPAEASPHRSWVVTDKGRGYLDFHSAGVYTVQLDTGEQIYRRAGEFANASEMMS